MANPKQYHRPTTLEQALELARQSDTLLLAGGALVLGTLDLAQSSVIDLQAIPELHRFDADEGGITVGAGVTFAQLLEWEQLPDVFRRAIIRAIPLNVRSNLSILESLRERQHPMLREWLAAITAHDIGVEWVQNDQRDWESIAGLLVHPAEFDTLFITAVDIPAVPPRQALGSAFVARTPADVPIVNAAVYLYLNDAGNVESMFGAVCGASADPVRAFTLDTLIGSPLDAPNIASAVKAIAALVDPVGDYLGSTEYRREMARVCIERALTECLAQLSV